MEEMVKAVFFESKEQLRKALFGEPYEATKFKMILQKMKKDLIGY